jgi:hypothetical protein
MASSKYHWAGDHRLPSLLPSLSYTSQRMVLTVSRVELLVVELKRCSSSVRWSRTDELRPLSCNISDTKSVCLLQAPPPFRRCCCDGSSLTASRHTKRSCDDSIFSGGYKLCRSA